jgi:hypothetical protein
MLMMVEVPLYRTPQGPVQKLVVFDLCAGIGIPIHALLSNLMRNCQTFMVEIVEYMVYETDIISRRFHDLLAQPLADRTRHRGNMENCVDDSNSLRNYDASVKVAVLMGTPCEKISSGVLFTKNPNKPVGLHVYPTSLAFVAHELLLSVQSQQKQIILIGEQVVPFAKTIEHQLQDIWGHGMIQVNAADYGYAERKRLYFTNPPVGPLHIPLHDPYKLFDGSIWPAPGQSGCRRPGTIKAILPHLAKEVQAGTADKSEQAQIKAFMMLNSVRGLMLPLPTHYMEWMGFPSDVISKLLQASPCAGQSSIHTDLTLPEAEHMQLNRLVLESFKPCAQYTYCRPCSELIERIGKSWNYPIAHEIINTTLAKSIHPDTQIPAIHIHDTPHRCSRPCAMQITASQARQMRSTAPRQARARGTAGDGAMRG